MTEMTVLVSTANFRTASQVGPTMNVGFFSWDVSRRFARIRVTRVFQSSERMCR